VNSVFGDYFGHCFGWGAIPASNYIRPTLRLLGPVMQNQRY